MSDTYKVVKIQSVLVFYVPERQVIKDHRGPDTYMEQRLTGSNLNCMNIVNTLKNNKYKNSIRDARTPQPREIFSTA